MKKVLIIITSLLILLSLTKNTYANVSSTNLLDPNLTSWDYSTTNLEGNALVNIKGNGLIEVNTGNEYFIMPTYINKRVVPDYNWRDLPYFDDSLKNNLILYDENNEPIESIVLSKKLFSEGIHVGYSYVIPEGVSKIKIDEFNLTSSSMTVNDVSNFFNEFAPTVDASMLFINALDIEFLPYPSNYIYLYSEASYDISNIKFGDNLLLYQFGNNYSDEVSPIIEVDKYTYKTSVNNPITIDNLMKEISLIAYDEIDGDLTSSITYLGNEYINNVISVDEVKSRVLGDYQIEFSVSDSSSNHASCVVYIQVVDEEKPIIDYNTSVINYTKEVFSDDITEEDIIANIHVTDNYSIVTSQIIENNYIGNENTLGEYKIKIRHTDLHDNYTDTIVTITNYDYTSPEISSSHDDIDISYTDSLPIENILTSLNIEVSDNYDAFISYDIITNNYLGNENSIGTYDIILRSIDSSGNTCEKIIYINVIDDVSPVFYLNKTTVNILEDELLDINSIKSIISDKYSLEISSFNIEIIKDNYSNNSKVNGKYEVGVKIIDEEGNLEYELLEVKVESNQSTGFISKVFNGIKKIFQSIWNIISWPFIKLFGLFF